MYVNEIKGKILKVLSLYIFQYFEDKNVSKHFSIRDLRMSLW